MNHELELARAVHGGKLELLCTEMQLLRCPSYHDVLLEGTGVIKASEHGRLSFHMVAPIKAWPPDPTLNPSRPHGEAYEPHDHVMLRAVDFRGREWRSNWILVKPIHPNTGSPNWIVSNELEQLSSASERPCSEKSEGRMYIPRQQHLPFDSSTKTVRSARGEDIEVRWSSDHHVRNIGSAEVEFRLEEDKWLQVTAKQGTPVMPHWAGLTCQALSFATARTVRPTLSVREFEDRVFMGIFSGPSSHYRSYLTPPIVSLWSQTASDFWMLVQRFVEWSMTNEDVAGRLFNELDGVRNGSSGSIQTAGLTLAVGIESLADVLLRDEAVSRDTSMDTDVQRLLEHVEAWQGATRVKDRAKSMLGPLRGRVRAVDRLYAFASRAGVPNDSIRSWKALRDMKAHGRTTEDDQGLYDLYYSAVELLYRLVCSTVGYDGQITRTSTRGWGIDQWGFPEEDEADDAELPPQPPA